MQTEAELQIEVLSLAGTYGAILGGLLGNALDNLQTTDIDSQGEVQALRNQVATQEQSNARDELLAALDQLLSFYAGAGS